MRMFGTPGASFATVPHDLHRRRRAPVSPFFSKAAVYSLEPQIRELIDKLCTRLKEFQKSNAPAELGRVFSALTTDVITFYVFGERQGSLDAPDFDPVLHRAIQASVQMTPMGKQFPWMIPLSRSMPYWLLNALDPLMMRMAKLSDVCAFSSKPSSDVYKWLLLIAPSTSLTKSFALRRLTAAKTDVKRSSTAFSLAASNRLRKRTSDFEMKVSVSLVVASPLPLTLYELRLFMC
jgi:hypothetical protein